MHPTRIPLPHHDPEWELPLGVCCAEAQADGVPCLELPGDCLHCRRAVPRKILSLVAARREWEKRRN